MDIERRLSFYFTNGAGMNQDIYPRPRGADTMPAG